MVGGWPMVSEGDSDDDLTVRMRAAVAEAVTSRAARLRTLSAPALVGVLSASALAPVIAAAAGAGVLLTAGVGVLGSVGANVLSGVVADATARLRVEPGVSEPSPRQIREAVADRIEAAFRSATPADREVRDGVVRLFQAVDVAGTALQTATVVDERQLVPFMVGAFSDLTDLFGEFAFVLVGARVSLERLHQEVRREVTRQSVDRERARRVEADIGRILDSIRDLQPRGTTPAEAGTGGEHPRWNGSPYRGLLPFEERHAAVFYGRRAMTSRLLGRLAEHLSVSGVMLVFGPSGAGKSSLLGAGLMASLADGRLVPGCEAWPRRVITPTADPIQQLATHLADLTGSDAIATFQTLTEHPEKAHLLAAQAVSASAWRAARDEADDGESARLVLVVDQLEELFTLAVSQAQQAAFVTALHAMATTPALPCGQPAALVVASLRGDFLDHAMAFEAFRDAVEAGPFTVGTMSEAELREAITGPAAEAGQAVPNDFVEAILDDLRDPELTTGFDSGALPLLSQVMFVLWQAGQSGGLTVADYRRTGGVTDIVRTSAERVYQGLTGPQREIARRVFIHLTAVADGRLTRRPATYGALRHASACDASDLDAVLEAFTIQRLITRTDHHLVAIAHEELLQSWTRLRDWLQPTITDKAIHQALVDDVQAWHGHNRDSSYLYRGSQLRAVQDAVERWATDPTGQLVIGEAATEFLAISRTRARHRRRITRTIAATLVVLLLLTSTAAVIANRNAARADEQHAVALSRQLAGQSLAIRDTDWSASQRLAAAALRVARTREALEAAGDLLGNYRSVIGLPSPVVAMAFSPNGQLIATTGVDDTVRLLDPATARHVGAPMTGHADDVPTVTFSPDGRLLATGSHDGTVRLWAVPTGKHIRTLQVRRAEPVFAVAFSADGQRLATAGSYGTVSLWDPVTGSLVSSSLTKSTTHLFTAAFSPDGRLLATANFDGTAGIVAPAEGKALRPPLPVSDLDDALDAVAFSPDGRLIATSDSGAPVQLWDWAHGKPVGAPLRDQRLPRATAFSPDGHLIATISGNDHKVALWNSATTKPVGQPLAGSDGTNTVAFSPNGRLLATGGNTVRLWDIPKRKPFQRPHLIGHTGAASAMAFSPDGQRLATGTDDTVRVWDPATAKPIGATLTGHIHGVSALKFSPDGHTLAAGNSDGTVQLWDSANNQGIEKFSGHTLSVRLMEFSPDSRLLATADGRDTVFLWNLRSHSPIGIPLAAPPGAITSLAFSPDGQMLAIGVNVARSESMGDGTVWLWDTTEVKPVGALTVHTGSVEAMTFSTDRRTLVTVGGDGNVRRWNLNTAKPTGATIETRTSPLLMAQFSPDGKLLATSGHDNVLQLWDPNTSKPAGAPVVRAGYVNAMAIGPNGPLLATNASETVELLPLADHTDPIGLLCAQAGPITAAEWAKYAESEPFLDVCPVTMTSQ